ncbi:hypothetical protein Taro_004957 [Colocasia esculenta]|uniref:protein-serine/threonine phosphatase n=1 Tax=Colocasia esculenta TaxID=4460 RepID=A0A843TRM9_COLES|nr:hypothetical protein [Colocasia esculenta]
MGNPGLQRRGEKLSAIACLLRKALKPNRVTGRFLRCRARFSSPLSAAQERGRALLFRRERGRAPLFRRERGRALEVGVASGNGGGRTIGRLVGWGKREAAIERWRQVCALVLLFLLLFFIIFLLLLLPPPLPEGARGKIAVAGNQIEGKGEIVAWERRALRMGSCLSSDNQRGSPTSAEAAASRKQRRGVKKRLSRASSGNKSDEQLHRIPGRMFLNGASSVASLFTQQGRKGINQDAMIVWEVRCSTFVQCFLFNVLFLLIPFLSMPVLDLTDATNNFDNRWKLGQGVLDTVYYGVLEAPSAGVGGISFNNSWNFVSKLSNIGVAGAAKLLDRHPGLRCHAVQALATGRFYFAFRACNINTRKGPMSFLSIPFKLIFIFFICLQNFGSRMDTIFCGVFDGHGPFGHMVARRVRDSLPLKLSAHWEVNANCDDAREKGSSTVESITTEEFASMHIEEEPRNTMDSREKGKRPEIFLTLKESFLKAFKVMDKELRVHPSIDSFCSGTTAVTLIKQGQDLIIGNVGDSRAILGTRDQDNCLTAVQLTVDLKPDLPSNLVVLCFV